jgi:nucleoside-diphosphate-sugar epimerase
MNIFLTGGTGLLGNNIIKALLGQNHSVTALVRSIEKGSNILDSDVALVEADLLDIDGYVDHLSGMDALVHAAACYSEFYRTRDADRAYETNVKGTIALLQQAHQQGIRKVVYISSAGVLKTGKNQTVDESAPYDETTADPYFRSKILAEKEVLNFAYLHPDMMVNLLLPSAMLGPEDWGPTPSGNLIRRLLNAEFNILLPGSNRIVDARDVAMAVLAVLEKGITGGRYLIGGRKYAFSEIYETLGQVTNMPMPRKRPFTLVLMCAAYLMAFKSKLNRRPPMMNPSILKRLLENFGYDSSKAKKELGIRFRPLSETLTDTAGWFQQQLKREA